MTPTRVRWGVVSVAIIGIAALLVAVSVSFVVIFNQTGRIRALLEDSRVTLSPELQTRQQALVSLERLRTLGEIIADAGLSPRRAEALERISQLTRSPFFAQDAALTAALHQAETAAAGLALARDEAEKLRSSGQIDAAQAIEAPARQLWRGADETLTRLSDQVLSGLINTPLIRTQMLDSEVGAILRTVIASYLMLLAALGAAALLMHRILLRPILLATSVLEHHPSAGIARLPATSIAEIDLFYRSVERISASLTEIEEANRQARAAQADLRRLASIDELTGVANRRWFTAMANRELERCRRFKHPLALLMLDVDHFKRVNDGHGHAVGDEVLKAFTRILEGNLRSIDLLGRLGGEEFAVILPETDQAASLYTAERLRGAVESLEFPLPGGQSLRVTTSVGIASLAPGSESLDSLLARADAALYAAKNAGRNRVASSGQPAGPP